MIQTLNDKCHGLAALVGADQSDWCCHLINIVITRISGWKAKLLSIIEEILIKSILQAVQVYSMMVIKKYKENL